MHKLYIPEQRTLVVAASAPARILRFKLAVSIHLAHRK